MFHTLTRAVTTAFNPLRNAVVCRAVINIKKSDPDPNPNEVSCRFSDPDPIIN